MKAAVRMRMGASVEGDLYGRLMPQALENTGRWLGEAPEKVRR